MRTRISSSNKITLYVIVFILVIASAVLLFGVGAGMMPGYHTIGMARINWGQLLIGFGIGLLAGMAFFRRK